MDNCRKYFVINILITSTSLASIISLLFYHYTFHIYGMKTLLTCFSSGLLVLTYCCGLIFCVLFGPGDGCPDKMKWFTASFFIYHVVASVFGYIVVCALMITRQHTQDWRITRQESPDRPASFTELNNVSSYRIPSRIRRGSYSDKSVYPPVPMETNCPICHDQVTTRQTLAILPCNHTFHNNCIDPWFERSHKCPICKQTLGEAESLYTQTQNVVREPNSVSDS